MKRNTLLTGAVFSVAAAAAIFGLVSRSEAASLTNNKLGGGTTINNVATTTPKNKLNQADMAAKRAEQVKIRTAIETAINTNNYEAWVTAVGADSPIAKIITKDKFSKFVEAYNLRLQADKIMTDLGVAKGIGEGQGFGFGMGHGEGRGMGHGLGNGRGLHLGQALGNITNNTNK